MSTYNDEICKRFPWLSRYIGEICSTAYDYCFQIDIATRFDCSEVEEVEVCLEEIDQEKLFWRISNGYSGLFTRNYHFVDENGIEVGKPCFEVLPEETTFLSRLLSWFSGGPKPFVDRENVGAALLRLGPKAAQVKFVVLMFVHNYQTKTIKYGYQPVVYVFPFEGIDALQVWDDKRKKSHEAELSNEQVRTLERDGNERVRAQAAIKSFGA